MKILNPVEIEAEITRLSDKLEETTYTLAERAEAAAKAEVAYKLAHAKAYLVADGRDVKAREAIALVAVEDQYTERTISEAMHGACQEMCRTLRAQLDALRTLSANVRNQT